MPTSLLDSSLRPVGRLCVVCAFRFLAGSLWRQGKDEGDATTEVSVLFRPLPQLLLEQCNVFPATNVLLSMLAAQHVQLLFE